MKLNLVSLGSLLAGAIAVTLVCTGASATAATVKMEVKVPGSIAGSNWVLVKQRAWPQYGGRVRYESGQYVTDDVKRGETMRITVTPSAGESTAPGATFYDIWCAAKGRYVLQRWVTLPYVDSGFVVPLDPSMDDLYVEAWTNLGYFPFRIPIGPRVL